MTVKPGLCQCGCGQETRLASRTQKSKGWVKGQPLKYLPWHHLWGIRRKMVEPRAETSGEINYYPESEARRFVHYLLCWTYWGYQDAIFRRDQDEFRSILQKVINQGRTDQVGVYEIAAAKRELAVLKQDTKKGEPEGPPL